MRNLTCSILMIVALIASPVCGPASAETYIGGAVGATFSAKAGSVEIKDPTVPSGTTSSNLSLDKALMLDGKLGHYFSAAPWFGIEGEVFSSNPNQGQQAATFTTPSGSVSGTLAKTDLRVTAAAVNMMVRYPGVLLQPYAGVGVGVFVAKYGTQTDTAPGLNALAGLRIKVAEHVGVFAEYKYNRADFSFNPTATTFGASTTYQAHSAVIGAAYHF